LDQVAENEEMQMKGEGGGREGGGREGGGREGGGREGGGGEGEKGTREGGKRGEKGKERREEEEEEGGSCIDDCVTHLWEELMSPNLRVSRNLVEVSL
jgi:hypothetical protein